MIAGADQKINLVGQLIHSCYRAQEGYRSAASAVEDNSLRKLFEIYAQQRIRFAEELREYLPLEQEKSSDVDASGSTWETDSATSGRDTIRTCLEIDSRTLELYKEALAFRALPTRAQFLVSAQLALLERVHDRMNLMLHESGTPVSLPQRQRVSA